MSNAKYVITKENAEEIAEYRKGVKDKYTDRRMYAVQLVGEGKKVSDICKKLDCDKRQISDWRKSYCTKGIKGLDPDLGGRRHENMTFEEEAAFIAQFKEKADKGLIVRVSEIKAAYEKLTHTTKSKGHIYKILKRHGWRKVKPRGKHPKAASKEVQETRLSLRHD